jgi:uncharacterized protein YegP (UPF0339 family)
VKVIKQVHLDDGEIEYCRDADDRIRFRVKGDNGEIVVTSEGYETEGNARRGLSTLKRILSKAPIL